MKYVKRFRKKAIELLSLWVLALIFRSRAAGATGNAPTDEELAHSRPSRRASSHISNKGTEEADRESERDTDGHTLHETDATGESIEASQTYIDPWEERQLAPQATQNQGVSGTSKNPSRLPIGEGVHQRKSPISRLPNEVLFNILRYVSDDEPAFFCLRQVSRNFRNLVNAREFRFHTFSTYHACDICNDADMDCPKYGYYQFPWATPSRLWGHGEVIDETLSLVNKDRLCQRCWDFDESSEAWTDIWGSTTFVSKYCKFQNPPTPLLHCAGCEADHPSLAFSVQEQSKPPRERVCAAREGFVRLCDHVTITWAEIEAQILGYQKPDDDESFPEIWEKRCSDPSHHSYDGTLAQPRAVILCFAPQNFVLEMTWEPVSAFSTYENGTIAASEMRSVCQKYRDDAAHFFFKSPPGSLPEMVNFLSSSCNCLRDEGASSATPKISYEPADFPGFLRHRAIGRPGDRSTHEFPVFPLTRTQTISHKVIGWRPSTHGEIPIMRTSYLKRVQLIDVWVATTSDAMYPHDDWMHALDPDSYTWAGDQGARETCRDVACRNHYMQENCQYGHRGNTQPCDTPDVSVQHA